MVKKFSYIDALRGFAVMGVILVHTGLRFGGLPNWLNSITEQGARGVQLFFILSALTLFHSLQSRSAKGELNSLNFFIRRFFRIAPLFYLAAIIYTARDIFLNEFGGGGYSEFNPFSFISTFLLFTNNLNPYWINEVVPGGWSITVEMSFYLIVPFLFLKIKTLRRAVSLLIVSFGICGIFNLCYRYFASNVINHNVLESYLFYWLPNQLPVFILGILLHFVIKVTKETQINIKWMLALSFIALLTITQLNIPNTVNHFIFSILFAVIVWLFSKHSYKFFVNKFTILIGKLSFSMYLIHFIVLQITGALVSKLGLGDVTSFILLLILTTSLTVGGSFVTYYLIEKPGVNLGNAIISKLGKKESVNSLKRTRGTNVS